MLSLHRYTLMACLAILTLAAQPAFAQRDATAKGLGNYGSSYSGRAAGRSVRHAQDYSHGLREYSRAGVRIPSAVAKREVKAIQNNLSSAKQEYATLRKAASEDKDALALLDALDKHVADADAALLKMHECCETDEIDSKVMSECCGDMDAALEQVHMHHEKLMKRIENARGATGKKK